MFDRFPDDPDDGPRRYREGDMGPEDPRNLMASAVDAAVPPLLQLCAKVAMSSFSAAAMRNAGLPEARDAQIMQFGITFD